MKVKIVPLCTVMLAAFALAPQTHAAKVNANLSYETADYGDDYSYAGPRLEFNLNPSGSNWYFDLGYRNREHDTKQLYTRVEGQASYRFRFDGGWIQPSVKHQIDTTNYENNSRNINTLSATETKYHLTINNDWALWGEVQVGLMEHENKTTTAERKADYFNWEIETGAHYYFNPTNRFSFTYYNIGKLSDKGETWDLTDDSSSQQVRLYYYWKTPIGLTISPYVRQSIGYGYQSDWYDDPKFYETETESKLTRYAMRLDYPLSDTIRAQIEYYHETNEYKEGKNKGKEDGSIDYIRAGLSFNF
ncbi:hypothetical protein [Vibrio alfacsensis]|uniref:hypothetical protein n=1 Tax=Vibrio alfacsensis TaxID=1074311 RepID=UPI004067C6DA